MSSPTRFDFAATQSDELVFTCGGRSRSNEITQEAFIFPDKISAIKVRPLPQARSRHAISVTNDRRFIVSGGVCIKDGQLKLADCVLSYDPEGDRWDEFARLPLGASQLVADVLEDKLVIIGGDNGTITQPGKPLQPIICRKDVQVLDMETGQWSFGKPKPIPETGVTSAVLDDEVFVVSSYDDFGTVTASVEVYNVITDSWRKIPDMPTPRTGVPCGFINGKLYCINGQGSNLLPVSAVEAYDPATNLWEKLELGLEPSMSQAYANGNNSLIIFGGVRL